MAAITTCRNWTAMHNSAPVGPPSRSRAIRWSLFEMRDRKSTRLNSSHGYISYAVFCLKKKKTHHVRYQHHCPESRRECRTGQHEHRADQAGVRVPHVHRAHVSQVTNQHIVDRIVTNRM